MNLENDDLTISDTDLVRITGYRTKARQATELEALGIKFLTRRDGTPVVFRETITALINKPE